MAKSSRCLLPADNICPALIGAQGNNCPGGGVGRALLGTVQRLFFFPRPLDTMPRWECFQGRPEGILPGSWLARVRGAETGKRYARTRGSADGEKGALCEMCWVTSARRFVLPGLLVAVMLGLLPCVWRGSLLSKQESVLLVCGGFECG